ncbi:hypothetical protein ACIBQ1_52505 [Nonomuraea sp. NPDC050153]|uniref:hypothetical protein n=1 Tax=Nonomuraea sp. NPDC050153 TaxID=3364359 RepID=UPI0037B44A4E
MTRYAADHARNALVARWSTGIGDVAVTVAALPPSPAGPSAALRLAAQLTELSQACWRCYTHPAGTSDQHEPGGRGWYRQRERDAFATVVPILTRSDRFGDHLRLSVSTKVGEIAQRVGCALRALDSPELTAQVVTDIAAELAAVEQAECDNLSGRAQQAVTLSREDASPLQVAQANAFLNRQPFGSEELITQIDPAAAAIAAAHWLHAAAATTGRHVHRNPVQVMAEGDRLRPLAAECLIEIVRAISFGATPRQTVMPLIRHTLHVAEGHLCGVTDAKRRIAAAERLLARARSRHPHLDVGPGAACLPITSLDPARPALDLLDNLMAGIHGCWLRYAGHARTQNAFSWHDPNGDWRHERHAELFLTEVRQEAATRHQHLL